MVKFTLIANPGSSSRKYALFYGPERLQTLHFEYEAEQIICSSTDANRGETGGKLPQTWPDFSNATATLPNLFSANLTKYGTLSAILIRTVATGDYFTTDHLVDAECLRELQRVQRRMPLHIPVVIAEIKQLSRLFPDTPLILVSDSAFHADRPAVSRYYGIDPTLANRHEIKRYGMHGLSVSSVVNQLHQQEKLPHKLIVCHLGSGCSVTAVNHGKSLDTTMGYTPLEGVVMATRSGNLDPAAALAIGRALRLPPLDLEEYLNTKSGLLGVSGITNDLRQIIQLKNQDNPRAKLAYNLFIYHIQTAIGRMAATLNGADLIVFTATIGERNAEVRRDIMKKLTFLGCPSTVIPSDEASAMLRQAKNLF